MLIHPWDAALDAAEWQDWLASTDRFGILAVNRRHADVAADAPPYARMLAGIRGVRLEVLRVEAKCKYDDHNPPQHRERVIDRLEERDRQTHRDRP